MIWWISSPGGCCDFVEDVSSVQLASRWYMQCCPKLISTMYAMSSRSVCFHLWPCRSLSSLTRISLPKILDWPFVPWVRDHHAHMDNILIPCFDSMFQADRAWRRQYWHHKNLDNISLENVLSLCILMQHASVYCRGHKRHTTYSSHFLLACSACCSKFCLFSCCTLS